MGGPYLALLRGVNVGSKNRLGMADLKRAFVDLGASDVSTHLQSGNVLFRADDEPARSIGERASALLLERHSLKLPVVVRSLEALEAEILANPLATGEADDLDQLHVFFLLDRPTEAQARTLDPDRSPPDTFALVGSAVYARCPGGLARTKLTNAYFDGKLKTVSTCRNWRTATMLRELLGLV